ncbi:hypothetical protein Z949_2537 [Sulfitobacter guttiformis KCTC 32187]|nr:hypothetical protein Z949_2537 [Sulfitobacter guttiformis KCTC 32187]
MVTLVKTIILWTVHHKFLQKRKPKLRVKEGLNPSPPQSRQSKIPAFRRG